MEPLALHPENPRYFLFRGRPAVLITMGEHYGAVINRDFDYLPYLDTLAANDFNLTRLFAGALVETEHTFPWLGDRNTLAPRPDRLLAPWRRVSAGDGGNGYVFDLDQWDENYFARLRDFVAQAARRGIVVEVVFFSQMYNEEVWRASPLHAAHNVNGVGAGGWRQFTTLADPALVARQERLIRRVVAELKSSDNVYYEPCNEPAQTATDGDLGAWLDHMIQTIVDAEATFPARHLIALQDPATRAHPAISVHNFHYAVGHGWVGALEGVERYSHLNQALAFDETVMEADGVPHGELRGDAWEFLLAGGAVYDCLSAAYTPSDPSGRAGAALHRQLRTLAAFMGSLDLVRMRPDPTVIRGGLPPGARGRVLAHPGHVYALYLRHGPSVEGAGAHRATLRLALAAGSYQGEWVHPRDGRIDRMDEVVRGGADVVLTSPDYGEDIALRLVAINARRLSTTNVSRASPLPRPRSGGSARRPRSEIATNR